jgi:EAL and modified HD-GYP domain-containing signal transduction protein
MTPSVLGSVTLGYELIWNQKRHCSGVRLFVDADSQSAVDARHLVAAITALWSESAPMLLLHVRSPSLLSGLLDQDPVPGVWLEIPDHWLSETQFANQVRKARARGLQLVWSGDPGQAPDPVVGGLFHKALRTLTPHEALTALRVSLRQQQDGGMGSPQTAASPVVAGCIYEGLASQALLEHALDRQGAWAVVGWPAEEILYAYRLRQIQPSRQLLRALIKAIEADASLETLEHRMGDEPLLVYRFLRYANSAHLGARCEVTSVRQGLMVMGYTKLRTWLMEQIPHASGDPNLDPIRFSMVLRARTMEHLADAGIEDDLRREVFMCGIFSQLDLLLGEPLGAAIHRLPLPGRIASAVVGQNGPYAPWLEVASALESSNTRMIRGVCIAHKMPVDEVNRALLRTLSAI